MAAQSLLQRLRAGGLQTQQDFLRLHRIFPVAQVILGQERFQNFVLILFATGIRPEGAVAKNPATANHQHFNHCQAMTAINGHHIQIALTGFRVLLLLYRLNRR